MIASANGTTLEAVRALLEKGGKRPVLLYIPARQKRPIESGWTKFTYQQTQEKTYQKLLRDYPNTGVVLGVGDLCSFDFDTDVGLATFLILNPAFMDTLRTRGKRGAQLWAYVTGNRPHQVQPLKVEQSSSLAEGAEKIDADGNVTIGEFRAEGGQSVIRGIHPDGCHYTWLVEAPPITVKFDAIQWPDDIEIPWNETEEKPSPIDTPKDNSLLHRAIEAVSIDLLWAHFGLPPRKRNPTESPLRTDNTKGHDSFSVYDQGRRFKDHNAAYSAHRGNSYDFYCLYTGKAYKQAFCEFVELAGLGHELEKNKPKNDPKAEKDPFSDASNNETLDERKERLYEKYKSLRSKPLDDASLELPDELIKGILYLSRRMLLSGASKSRKSFLAHQIAFCVSKGLPLFGRFPTNIKRVEFVNMELMEATSRRRFDAIAAALHQDNTFENISIISASNHLDLIGDDFVEYLSLQSNDDEAKLVVIDPMWRLLGNRDENSNTAIGQVLAPLSRFSRESGASCLGVHHFAKGSAALKEAIDRSSGAGAWARDASTIGTLTNHKEPDAYTIEIASNDFAPIDKFCVRFVHPVFMLAPDLDPEELKLPNTNGRAAPVKSANDQDKILAVLYVKDTEGGLNHTSICKFTGLAKSTVTNHLKRLTKPRGKVVKSSAGKGDLYMLSAAYRTQRDKEYENE